MLNQLHVYSLEENNIPPLKDASYGFGEKAVNYFKPMPLGN